VNKNIIRSMLSDQYHVYVILFIIDKPMRVLVEQENVKVDIVSVIAMTSLKCTACAEYDPPNCKCRCHEVMRYYERKQAD